MVLSQETHCSLVILMTLAHHYETKGVMLCEISEENHIPEETLAPIAQRLCDLDIARCQVGEDTDVHFLFLKRAPTEISAYDIAMLFDSEVFSGRFISPDTGVLLPKSKLNNVINAERKHMLEYIRKRLKKINIAYWSEQVYQTTFFYHD